MKNNGQYVGVDEKYVPEDEKSMPEDKKYVDNTLNSEIKNDMNNIYKGAKEYVSDKDNQEKMKNIGRKSVGFLKGAAIGYLALFAIIFIVVIAVFFLIFNQFFKMNKKNNEVWDNANNTINKSIDTIGDTNNKIKVDEFNFNIESYSGTQDGTSVAELLDKVVTTIKKNSSHSITVIYGTTTTSNTDKITTLKKQFDNSSKYEVSLDYDSNGYINKVTITNY